MIKRRQLAKWLAVLVALHGVIACAGFFAPYDPVAQDRQHPYAPPSKLHFLDTQGHVHMRPFFYPLRIREGFFDRYEEDTARTIPLKFFVDGSRYKLLGLVQCRLHLFGVDDARVYLLGSDGYGRDQLARILYGGQVSLLAGWLGAGITLFLGFSIGAMAGYYGGAKERDFVRAARGFGASDQYLLRRHIFPETSSLLMTQATILVPQYVLAEMTLSFLGLGVPEPVASWGNLLGNLQQYSVLMSYWWMYLPALVIVPFFLCYLGLASALQEWANFSKIEG